MSAPRPAMAMPAHPPAMVHRPAMAHRPAVAPAAMHRPQVYRPQVHRPQAHIPQTRPAYGHYRPTPHYRRPPLLSAPVAPLRMQPVQRQRPVVMNRDRHGHWRRHHGPQRPHTGRPDRPNRPGLHYPGGGHGLPYVQYLDTGAGQAYAPAYTQAYEPPLTYTHGEPPVIPAYGLEHCTSPMVIHIGAGADRARPPVTHALGSECGRPQVVHYNTPHAGNVRMHRAPSRAHRHAGKKQRKQKGITVVRARH